MIDIRAVVQLRPSFFENEFEKADWSNKYLYEDQFKGVSLRFKKLGQPGDIAKTIFGSSLTIIDEIEYDHDGCPFIILTNNFTITYPVAFENNEIKVYPAGQITFEAIKAEENLISDLEFFELNYLEKIFNVMERENNKFAMYKLGFYLMIREGKWKNVCWLFIHNAI